MTETPSARLARALSPRSVAVVGASPRPGSLSLRFLTGLVRHGFDGRIVAVNPGYEEVGGFPCVPSVAEAGEIDLAVVAVSKARVLGALEDCARSAVGGAVVFASGYSETGPEGRVEEERVAELARRTGLRVIGPNSPGLVKLWAMPTGRLTRQLQHTGEVLAVAFCMRTGSLAAGGLRKRASASLTSADLVMRERLSATLNRRATSSVR